MSDTQIPPHQFRGGLRYALYDEGILTFDPTYSDSGAGGLDLVATSKKWVGRTHSDKKKRKVGGYWQYGTNLVFEIPFGFVGLLLPKSSSRDYSQILSNSVGLIDPSYRGEVFASFRPDGVTGSSFSEEYEVGDQICQLVIVPVWVVQSLTRVKKSELSETERGENGHGEQSEVVASKLTEQSLTLVEKMAAASGQDPEKLTQDMLFDAPNKDLTPEEVKEDLAPKPTAVSKGKGKGKKTDEPKVVEGEPIQGGPFDGVKPLVIEGAPDVSEKLHELANSEEFTAPDAEDTK